ncbi:hypothetical protein [Microbulbifer sp. GL-2]|uniref:hypothetical protein n=1 Tax=Microbulbifer sp. GL-2 TaxID=2591606 RepID=UPI00155ABF0C|nr:hypothetical protein [Microbulbifer sp. GL-2]
MKIDLFLILRDTARVFSINIFSAFDSVGIFCVSIRWLGFAELFGLLISNFMAAPS